MGGRASIGALLVATAAALSATADPTGSSEHDKQCALATTEFAIERAASLDQALQSGDVEAIVAHYSPDAILMAAGEPMVHLGRKEILAYHARQPIPDRVTSTGHAIERGCNTFSLSGIRHQTWRAPAPASARVRYRLLLAYQSDRWLVIHDHAELLEGALPAALPAIAIAPANRITTGTTGTASSKGDIALPPPSFALPSAPPVFVPWERPELLAAPRLRPAPALPPAPSTVPAQATPAPPTETVIAIPALPSGLTAHDLPEALQPPRREDQRPVVVARPVSQPAPHIAPVQALSFARTWAPPDVSQWSAPPRKAEADDLTSRPPPPSIHLAPSPVEAAGSPSVVPPKASDPVAAEQSTGASAVAGFTKRAASPPSPPQPAKPPLATKSALGVPTPQPSPQRKATTRPAAATPSPDYPAYRAGRWVDDRPVYGN